MTLDEFAALVKAHDLTYEYSDDHWAWVRGIEERSAIRQAAKQFPAADVKRIWDAEVDRKMVEGYREMFYWRQS